MNTNVSNTSSSNFKYKAHLKTPQFQYPAILHTMARKRKAEDLPNRSKKSRGNGPEETKTATRRLATPNSTRAVVDGQIKIDIPQTCEKAKLFGSSYDLPFRGLPRELWGEIYRYCLPMKPRTREQKTACIGGTNASQSISFWGRPSHQPRIDDAKRERHCDTLQTANFNARRKAKREKNKQSDHINCPECTRHIVRQPSYHPFMDPWCPSSPFIPCETNLLLCGNQQTYLEVTSMIYSKNTFVFSPCSGSLERFAAVLRPAVAEVVRHIVIDATYFRSTGEGKMPEFLRILTKSFQLDTLTLPVLQDRRHVKPNPSTSSLPKNWTWMLSGSTSVAHIFPDKLVSGYMPRTSCTIIYIQVM